jgi:hypothetical protein
MNVHQVNAYTLKIRTTKAAVAASTARPYMLRQDGAGSSMTHNGNVINPIGGPWYWLAAFPGVDSERRLLADLEVIEKAEAQFKAKK